MIAVVIPCFKVKKHILQVIEAIGDSADKVYVIDDCCPEETGKFVLSKQYDQRVQVLFHKNNLGVGGAMITGYKKAIQDDCSIAIKIDGDGQMDPTLIPYFIDPIRHGIADYTKGNRFFYLEGLVQMPKLRLLGNAALSFVNKISSGYWDIMDPTNGYTAINLKIIQYIPLEKISTRYFFESDMLFRLNIAKAIVIDIPMDAKYADETSNLSIPNVLFSFPPKYLKCFIKRIFYNYFLRDFNIGSIALVFSILSLLFGIFFGAYHWLHAIVTSNQTPTGTIMISVLPLIIGFQTLLFFLQQDVASTPKRKYFNK